MKILHIIVGLYNGGAEGALYRLAAADKSTGYQHFVISMMDRGVYADRLEQAGSMVGCLYMPRGKLTLRGLFRLYRYIKIIKPDVVQTWMYHADLVGGIVARFAGIRAITWGIRHSNFDPDKNKKLSLLIIRICARLSSYVPAQIACCSQKAVSMHERIGYRANKITVIPNGYALDKVKPCLESRNRLRGELGLDERQPVIGMVARFDPQKDHRNLIQALACLDRQHIAYTCLLVGANMTPENTELSAWIDEAGVRERVLLLGPRNDVPAIMTALDVHVLSSLGEAFPNVLAEAMACGTPCVTTDVGDAALIVGDTGWVAPARDAEKLAHAIGSALTAQGRADSWQERQLACRERIVQNFGLPKMVASYHKLWAASLNIKTARPDTGE